MMGVMPNQDAKRLTLNAKRNSNGQWLRAKGFTLVELLVVLGLLSITVGSTLIFLTSTLRGSNSAAITAEVKQNGQSVLDSLERQMRGSKDVNAASNKHIILTKQNDELLHISCFDPTGTENGWIGSVILPVGNDGSSKNLYLPVTNKEDLVSGISVTNCDFKVSSSTPGSTSPKAISLEFVMNQGVQAPSRSDFIANTKFQTTISLR